MAAMKRMLYPPGQVQREILMKFKLDLPSWKTALFIRQSVHAFLIFLRCWPMTDTEHLFEKSFIHFLVTTDIASHIHLLKHRIGVSVNSESARYKELMEDKIYVPTDWPPDERIAYIQHAQLCFSRYHETLDRLVAQGVSRKRAKESARFYLPYGMQYTADIAFNFRSFYHFVKLRYSMHAQEEIREIARCMLQAVHETGKFDLTLQAFGLVKDGKLIKPFGGKKK